MKFLISSQNNRWLIVKRTGGLETSVGHLKYNARTGKTTFLFNNVPGTMTFVQAETITKYKLTVGKTLLLASQSASIANRILWKNDVTEALLVRKAARFVLVEGSNQIASVKEVTQGTFILEIADTTTTLTPAQTFGCFLPLLFSSN